MKNCRAYKFRIFLLDFYNTLYNKLVTVTIRVLPIRAHVVFEAFLLEINKVRLCLKFSFHWLRIRGPIDFDEAQAWLLSVFFLVFLYNRKKSNISHRFFLFSFCRINKQQRTVVVQTWSSVSSSPAACLLKRFIFNNKLFRFFRISFIGTFQIQAHAIIVFKCDLFFRDLLP